MTHHLIRPTAFLAKLFLNSPRQPSSSRLHPNHIRNEFKTPGNSTLLSRNVQSADKKVAFDTKIHVHDIPAENKGRKVNHDKSTPIARELKSISKPHLTVSKDDFPIHTKKEIQPARPQTNIESKLLSKNPQIVGKKVAFNPIVIVRAIPSENRGRKVHTLKKPKPLLTSNLAHPVPSKQSDATSHPNKTTDTPKLTVPSQLSPAQKKQFNQLLELQTQLENLDSDIVLNVYRSKPKSIDPNAISVWENGPYFVVCRAKEDKASVKTENLDKLVRELKEATTSHTATTPRAIDRKDVDRLQITKNQKKEIYEFLDLKNKLALYELDANIFAHPHKNTQPNAFNVEIKGSHFNVSGPGITNSKAKSLSELNNKLQEKLKQAERLNGREMLSQDKTLRQPLNEWLNRTFLQAETPAQQLALRKLIELHAKVADVCDISVGPDHFMVRDHSKDLGALDAKVTLLNIKQLNRWLENQAKWFKRV